MNYDEFKHTVIYEDNHLLVVNKPNNILVQGDITQDKSLLDFAKNYIKIQYNKPGAVFLGLVHRLDRPVSGALIFARTSKALSRMNKIFKERGVQKEYLAISEYKSLNNKGLIENFLIKDNKKNIVRICSKAHQNGKRSISKYTLVGSSSMYYLYKLTPVTGRSHQLRVHMKSLSCSILGDLKYGANKPLPDKSIALHCHAMTFLHPTTKELIVVKAATPPGDHWKKVNKLVSKI